MQVQPPPATQPDIVETTIVKTEKEADESSKKLEEMTAPVLSQAEPSEEGEASSTADFLSNKQYQDFT